MCNRLHVLLLVLVLVGGAPLVADAAGSLPAIAFVQASPSAGLAPANPGAAAARVPIGPRISSTDAQSTPSAASEPGFRVWAEGGDIKATCGGVECLPKGCDNSAGGCFCIWGIDGNCGQHSCLFNPGCKPAM